LNLTFSSPALASCPFPLDYPSVLSFMTFERYDPIPSAFIRPSQFNYPLPYFKRLSVWLCN
jgi:hypothetical protein